MTHRSKIVLVSAFLLALILVTGIAGHLWQPQTTPAQTYVYSFLIILNILAVPFLYWLRVRRHGAAAVVPDPAGSAAEDSHCGSRRPAGWRRLPSAVLYLICCILGTQLLYWLEDTRKSLFAIQLGYDLLLFYLLLVFGLLPWLFSDRIADQSWRNMLPLGCGFLYVVLAVIVRYLSSQFVILQPIMNGGINVIPNPLVLAVLLLLIPLLLLLRLLLPRRAVGQDCADEGVPAQAGLAGQPESDHEQGEGNP